MINLFKVDNRKENNITYRFTNKPCVNVGRRNRANVMTAPHGVREQARNTESPRSAFELFFSLDMIQNIVMNTNYNINQTVHTITPEVIAQKKGQS